MSMLFDQPQQEGFPSWGRRQQRDAEPGSGETGGFLSRGATHKDDLPALLLVLIYSWYILNILSVYSY